TIVTQIRKMGSSCDWSREKYTLDEERNLAVNEMFRMMLEDGIIERGYRVVNWDPVFKTTLSDDEVVAQETTAQLLTFTYDADFPISIATTRAETKFGDVAVAVHPDDKRYKKYVGKTFEPVFCGKKLLIKIVADEAVDPNFGTGAVGVTPAHSMIDADIASRHNLESIQVIDQNAHMMNAGVSYNGLTTIEARKKIETELKKNGLLQKSETVPQNIPTAERGGGLVEQLPMRQWFIRVNKPFRLRQATLKKWKKGDRVTLKELMKEAVASTQIRILPNQFEKIYFHWIDHLRDWCISRQIWFGHRIPVWYRGEEIKFSIESPGAEWEQDPDTLDTWFSSGMWTFSTLGWPEQTQELKTYHPTAVLETGYDIIFFWVARMILMTVYALGEIPFHDVYLHGMVRDEQGRKMSKSLGNALDPLDLIPKYGTDAVRLSLLIGTTPGQDLKLSEEKIAGFRNFTNKLWNIGRFILMQIESSGTADTKTIADKWILARLTEVTASVTKKLEQYEFSSAGEELRDFTWSDLADWYLEIAKVEKGKADILKQILETILKLWHPFMPFITEQLRAMAEFSEPLIIAPWPLVKKEHAPKEFEKLRTLVSDMRRFRAEQKIEPAKRIRFSLCADQLLARFVTENIEWIKRLANAETIDLVNQIPGNWNSCATANGIIGLDLKQSADKSEHVKTERELKEITDYIQSLEQKLANQEFVSKAPARIIDGIKEKLTDAEVKRSALAKRIKLLNGQAE
ncbi:MAG TPA: valine--tRNA ligase, partial [Patescibacteria group bacterium]|nr:valine--tRNA ligase [Patescibacteria group bacterium]